MSRNTQGTLSMRKQESIFEDSLLIIPPIIRLTHFWLHFMCKQNAHTEWLELSNAEVLCVCNSINLDSWASKLKLASFFIAH